MTDFLIIIPARFESTRLPGKVLLPVAGATLIQHVYRAAQKTGAKRVLIAVDDSRVEQHCLSFGAEVMMTDPSHSTGTDRLAECASRLQLEDNEIVVNLQGDEPLTPPAELRRVAQALVDHSEAAIATLCSPISDTREMHNPNAVKVVMDRRSFALYFSRAPIPWDRDLYAQNPDSLPAADAYRHIGIYAYRAGYLQKMAALPPADLERTEKLEQLRALHDGARIHVSVVDQPIPAGVDTEEDLHRVARVLGGSDQ